MEEIEVPTEEAQEHIKEHAEHAREKWIMQVALSSAIFAVLAAIAALLGGHHSNEAVIEEIRAANQWNYFQAKGIKQDIMDARLDMLAVVGKSVSDADLARQEKLKHDKDDAMEKAKEMDDSAQSHLNKHHTLAEAVTLFQITIAIGAISVLTRRRSFWLFSLASGAVGAVFFVQGVFLTR